MMRLTAFACSMLLLGGAGCIRREIAVETYPPGATVMLDRQYRGPSPQSAPFTYHGTRAVTVTAPGRQTITVLHTTRATGADLFPLDLITDGLLPVTFHRVESVTVTMPLRRALSAEERRELRTRADGLRERGRAIVPVPVRDPDAPPPEEPDEEEPPAPREELPPLPEDPDPIIE